MGYIAAILEIHHNYQHSLRASIKAGMVVARSYPSKFDFSRGDWKRLKKASKI